MRIKMDRSLLSSQSGLDFIDINDFTISHYGEESGIGNLETELNVMTSDSNGFRLG